MTATLFLSLAILLRLLVGAQDECFNQTVQLVDQLSTEGGVNGTVEYCLNGEWRTLCRGGGVWQAREAIVTCRQLGYEGGEQLSSFTPSKNESFRLAQNCDSTENSIEECGGIIELDDGCGELEYYFWPRGALRCLLANCTDGDMRLVGGSTNREGRVEVCMNGRWGTVCNNSQKGVEGAVCSKLGFPGRGAKVSKPEFVSAGAPIHTCSVTNDQAYNMYCEPASNETCNHTMDLWVSCRSHSDDTSVQEHCALAQSTTAGVLGATIGILVVLQAVALIILIPRKKWSQQSFKEYSTTTNESYSVTLRQQEQIEPDNYMTVGDGRRRNKGFDLQGPLIDASTKGPYEPSVMAAEMVTSSGIDDWNATLEVSTESDSFNEADTYAAVDKQDKQKPRNKENVVRQQRVKQAQTYPSTAKDEGQAADEGEDFYKAEQLNSAVSVKKKHQRK